MDQPKAVMKTQLPLLRALQDLDRQIFRVVKSQREKPRALAGTEKELTTRRADQEVRLKDAKAAKAEVDKRELDLKERETRRKRLEDQRDASKSNKEYQAFQLEIGNVKAESSKVEDEILGLMSSVEESGKKSAEAMAVLDTAESKYAAEKTLVDVDLAKLEDELKSLRERRVEAAKAVDSEFLARYDRIHKAKQDSVVLAACIQEGGRGEEGYQCGECRMEVTFQDVNVILKGKDAVSCRSCSRILYMDKAPQPAAK